MNKTKKLFGAFLLMGLSTLAASETPAELVMPIEEEIIVENDCPANLAYDYVDQYLVRLEKTVPASVTLNEEFVYRYVVTAKDKLKKVVVEDQIPKDTEYVSSSPTAQIEDSILTWTLHNLEKGETVILELVVKTSVISDFSNCATIVAYQEACTTTSVGVPELAIQTSTIMESVLLNTDVLWNITVSNTGNYCARNVVITDVLPDELSHLSGDATQVIELGMINPGDSREVSINTMATRSGKVCNMVVATSSNAESAEDEACIIILESGIDVKVNGPEKQFVGKKAVYTIDVVNTGEVSFDDVIVTNIVPPEGELIKAKGAEVDGNTATWVTNLASGETESFEVKMVIEENGYFCNEASISSADGSLDKSDSLCTEWGGSPALLIEVIDTKDPLIVGEETTYIIQIANQGSANDTNVRLDVNIPEGLSIVSVRGDTKGKISKNRKEVVFAPYPLLRAKEIIQYRIVAKAVGTGDLRFKANMSSDLLRSPVPEVESTQVY